MNDDIYMQRCLQLAEKGMGKVAPNPMVGAVLVHEGKIIGEGYHMSYGQAHAEVNCINSVSAIHKHLIAHSTLYVSLEPCNHVGKTPACSDFIIRNKIPEVVIACTDPFEKVNGSGISRLQSEGIVVRTGVLEKEALHLNRRFITVHTLHRPYIILKWAQTADERISGADGSPLKISNVLTDKLVHRWRTEEDGIMIGTGTLLSDNPSLTSRHWPGKNPVRVVIDKKLKAGVDSNIYDDQARTIIFNNKKDGITENITFIKIEESGSWLSSILKKIYDNKISSIIVEGGADLINYFIKENIWDEARVITNTSLQTGAGKASPSLQNARHLGTEVIRTDKIEYYQNSNRKH